MVPYVLVEAVVDGPPERAYHLAQDMESYPKFMKDVISLKVLERDGCVQVSEWVGRLQGKPLRWTERDAFDDERHTITYHQIAGDLKKFEGQWRFEPAGQGQTRISLSVDFDLGIPMISGLLDPVARLVVKRNCEDMLAAMQRQLALPPER